MKFIREWGLVILFALLMFLSRIYLWAPVNVSGHSMDPTLANGQRLIMLRTSNFKRSDIVVAKEIENGQTKDIIKRVVGMPGDKIAFDHDVLTINGEVFDESYLHDYLEAFKRDKLQETYAYDSFFQKRAQESQAFTVDAEGNPKFEITVPEGQYLLLGDNRIASKDSRQVGTFAKSDILGRTNFRISPLRAFGKIN